jgi:hypothetical protein
MYWLRQRLCTFVFWEEVAFWLLLGLHLLPLWRHYYFPTSDGPAHLYNAVLLKTMLLHPDNWAHQLLTVNFNPEPNYLSHLLLVALLTITPPWLADKLVLTLYVAGLPIALRYLLRAVRPGAGWLAVLGFPFVYSVVLVWGFYNFCLSLAVFLWVAGYWVRQAAKGWSAWSIAKLAALLGLLFAAHPLPYLVSGLLLGLLVLSRAMQRRSWAAAGSGLGTLLLAYLPTLPLLGWYFLLKGTATASPATDYASSLWEWLRLEPLHYFGSAEGSYRWMVAGLLALLGIIASRQVWRGAAGWPAAPWLVAGLLLLGAYVALPDAISGGSNIKPRWALLSYLLLLGALAAVPYPRWVRLATLEVGTLVAGLLLGFRWQKFETFQAGLAEYRSALPYLRPHTTLLALNYANVAAVPGGPDFGTYIPLFAHTSGQLGVEASIFCYENYEAATGYFPLTWRSGKAPLAEYAHWPAQLQPVLYKSAYTPTYVALWGRLVASPATLDSANATQVAQYLQQRHYRLRFRSPAGLLELYELPGARAIP